MRIQTHTLLSSQGCPFEASSAMSAPIKHGTLCCPTKTKYLPPAQNGVHFRVVDTPQQLWVPARARQLLQLWLVGRRAHLLPPGAALDGALHHHMPLCPLHHIPACPAVCVDPQHTPHLGLGFRD